MYPVLFTAFAGAFLGFLSNMLIGYLKSRSENTAGIWNKYCDGIMDAAHLASEYWILPMRSAPAKNATLEIKHITWKGEHLEAKIMGLMQYILSLDAMLQKEVSRSHREEIERLKRLYVIALTGGNFQSRTGVPEASMSREVEDVAAQYVAAVQKGIRDRLRIRRLWQR